MRLVVAGRTFPIAQLAPDRIRLAEPVELPTSQATICLQVDDEMFEWVVNLPEGISLGSPYALISVVPAMLQT